ncbi:xaa-pro aminopeptidase P [Rhynchospora pubera]|uniref:Xaa-pro aminopeptidase P n=1 Tax=Rhynchospora pubera TaxID=906938 RepID=A0AAV8EWZ4_9POAL|nr:xaa-pro aminopeptidase P [Rhynchospora pubera]
MARRCLSFSFSLSLSRDHLRRLLLPGGARSYRGGSQNEVKVGIAEFLRGIGGGVEGHVAKVEAEVGGDLQKLLQTCTLRLKKLAIPCKHRKLILNYAHKYRLGLWRPPPQP